MKNAIIYHQEKQRGKTFRKNLIITGELTRALQHSLRIPVILHGS